MNTPRVAEALAKLAMFAADEFSVDDMLWRLGEVAAAGLAVDGVGVMGTNSGAGDRTRFVYASRHLLEPMEYLQEANQTGPCHDAATTMRTVSCTTNDELDSWPDFAMAARLAGVRALVAAPMVSRGRCWGVLDLYWMTDTDLTPKHLAEVDLLAKVAVSYLVIADDRRQASIAQQQLAARLLHDPLTGLANRELIHELIYHALVNAQRRQRAVALLFIDLDRFKPINDTRGHRAGDMVLTEVAQRMRHAVRASDTVSRLSGDEFLILCEDLSDDDAGGSLSGLGTRILTAISAPITLETEPPVFVTASIGIAITHGQPSVVDLIHDADQAMYQAKRHQQRIVVHQHQHGSAQAERRALERQLFGALERGEMRVHYQPVIDVNAAGRVVAVEALLRWQHPERGLLSAADFIDFAVANGTIIRTGHWLIQEALRQLHEWREQAPGLTALKVFVNLTPQELIDQNLALVITEQLDKLDLDAGVLAMEITEKALDDPRVQSCATYFRAKGHPLAMDDFGTGYSSLARLVELPMVYLKLDRSLVSRLPDDPQARALLRAVLTIAETMSLEVIGEGVENSAQAEYLAAVGCTLQQGYHHGRPHSGAALTETLCTATVPDGQPHTVSTDQR